MRRLQRVLAATAVLAFATGTASANLLIDPSFEDPDLFFNDPSVSTVGHWTDFGGGSGVIADLDSFFPRTGTRHVDLTVSGSSSFAGIFQDVPISGGDEVTWTVWAVEVAGNNGVAIEMRIEWLRAGLEISRTANFTPTSLSNSLYEAIGFTAIAPPTADTARVVFAIQTFTPGTNAPQGLFVDDASFTIVPEPASLALLGLGGLAVLRRRTVWHGWNI